MTERTWRPGLGVIHARYDLTFTCENYGHWPWPPIQAFRYAGQDYWEVFDPTCTPDPSDPGDLDTGWFPRTGPEMGDLESLRLNSWHITPREARKLGIHPDAWGVMARDARDLLDWIDRRLMEKDRTPLQRSVDRAWAERVLRVMRPLEP
ncbi:hypothetical protein ACH0CA_01235 [Kytococcus sedentarius]|uniref:hypothetical protein n=1 Tax=Kytococcus sedentarius TaxID=1276 RepID=UPI00387932F3